MRDAFMCAVRVSVVVCTRNRADQIVACVESILANRADHFELLVVDQSDDRATESALACYASDPRFRHVLIPTRGLSRSRNEGIALTTGPIVAFTDDDCRASDDWVENIDRIFSDDPDVGLLFGRVELPVGASDTGFGASFVPSRREYKDAFPPVGVPWGIGANMAFRREVFDRVGLFDALLGAGGKFRAGEELDLTIRVLAAGFKVVNAHEVSLLHLGVREGEDASKLLHGYALGTGAALAKHWRLRTKGSRKLVGHWVVHHAESGIRNALLGRRPTGLGYLARLVWGLVSPYEYVVDAERRVYVDG
jgi:glycosyltransferase involved in cell wall biosynthesis